MVTVLDPDVPGVEQGNRVLVKPDGVVERSLGDESLDRVAREAALELLDAEHSEVRTLPDARGQTRAFVEVLEPPLRLLICGRGTTPRPSSKPPRTSGGAPSSWTTGPSS